MRSKHSVQLSDSTAMQSAVTKSTKITGRTFKKKHGSNNRYNATTDDRTSKSPRETGFSETRKLEDVSIFENEDRVSSLDKEIARIASRTSPAVHLGYINKRKAKKSNLIQRYKERTNSPRELKPKAVGLAKNVKNKEESPVKMSEY